MNTTEEQNSGGLGMILTTSLKYSVQPMQKVEMPDGFMKVICSSVVIALAAQVRGPDFELQQLPFLPLSSYSHQACV